MRNWLHAQASHPAMAELVQEQEELLVHRASARRALGSGVLGEGLDEQPSSSPLSAAAFALMAVNQSVEPSAVAPPAVAAHADWKDDWTLSGHASRIPGRIPGGPGWWLARSGEEAFRKVELLLARQGIGDPKKTGQLREARTVALRLSAPFGRERILARYDRFADEALGVTQAT
jgi:hypothetical protein